MKRRLGLEVSVLLILLATVIGCGRTPDPPPAPPELSTARKGPHGGDLINLEDVYYVEISHSAPDKITVYFLDGIAKNAERANEDTATMEITDKDGAVHAFTLKSPIPDKPTEFVSTDPALVKTFASEKITAGKLTLRGGDKIYTMPFDHTPHEAGKSPAPAGGSPGSVPKSDSGNRP